MKDAKTNCFPLTALGSIEASTSDVVAQGTRFISACYAQEASEMTKCRQKVWQKRTGVNTIVSASELKSLPPTSDSFHYHMLRAHIQTIIWLSIMELHPPHLDPFLYGWEIDPSGTFLIPKISTDGVSMAPDDILKLIKCGCKSNAPCNTGWCSCQRFQLGCTLFCACGGGENCSNPHTPHTSVSNEE